MGEEVVDIRNYSFEEFVDFLFDHEVNPIQPNDDPRKEPWYWHVDVEFDPIRVATHYIKLFTSPQILIGKFSFEQIEQGFWAIQSGNLACSADRMIWDKRIPLDIRESCIRSMFHLYEKLFSQIESKSAANMWWDSFAYDWYCGNRQRSKGGEDESMQDVMFETLAKILKLPNLSVQEDALHGLGHLMHPMTQMLIDDYLVGNPNLDEETINYAKAAAKFEVM